MSAHCCQINWTIAINIWIIEDDGLVQKRESHLQNDLFAHTLRYAKNFILGISIICLW